MSRVTKRDAKKTQRWLSRESAKAAAPPVRVAFMIFKINDVLRVVNAQQATLNNRTYLSGRSCQFFPSRHNAENKINAHTHADKKILLHWEPRAHLPQGQQQQNSFEFSPGREKKISIQRDHFLFCCSRFIWFICMRRDRKPISVIILLLSWVILHHIIWLFALFN